MHHHTKSLVEARGDLLRQRGCTRHREAHRRERGWGRLVLVEVEPRRVHRRHTRENGDAGVADERGRRHGIEATGEHECAPGGERHTERDVEAEDVVKRQRSEDSIVAPQSQAWMVLHLTDVRGEVPVREHGGLRRAGSARREEEHGDVARLALGTRHGLGFDGVEIDCDDRHTGSREHRLSGAGGEREARLDRGELTLQLARGRHRIDRDRDRPGVQHREVRGDERLVLGARDRDAVAGGDVTRQERTGEAGGRVGEMGVRRLTAAAPERDGPGRTPEQHFQQVEAAHAGGS